MSTYNYNIGRLFKEISSERADFIAIKYSDGRSISYTDLEILSNKICNFLISQNVRKGNVVAIFNKKSILSFGTMLACLKIGAIYTNLDPNSPFERLKKIIDRCKPSIIFYDRTEEELKSLIDNLAIHSFILNDAFEIQVDLFSSAKIVEMDSVTGSDPAYIMFTSGSTGFPKGAVISHSNLLNFIHWCQEEFKISKEDIFTNVNPIYFDNSVFDFYASVFSGAQLVPISTETAKDSFKLVKQIREAKCNSWFSVPSLLVYLLTTKALEKGSLPDMKRFIFGGEGFPKLKLKKLFELFGQQSELYNVYGPTECTCICSSYLISEEDFKEMNTLAPLGYLAANFDYVLLNDNYSDSFGELGLKGPNVGLGYYNDEERTRAAFIQNPINKNYCEIIYKSGDLVEKDEFGKLHFKGRADNQIKHMGYRIELEEIEASLNSMDCIDEAAAIYERLGDSLGQIIVYVAINRQKEEHELLSDMKKMLPEYMIPKRINILNVLPKNQNGKIDRVALKTIKKF